LTHNQTIIRKQVYINNGHFSKLSRILNLFRV